MKKDLSLSVAIGLLLVIGICFSAFAQEPFPYCTSTPEYCQKKVAQVPIPWQFWGIETDPDTGITTVIDRIRISPTWLNPPPGQPPGTAPVFIQRWVAVAPAPLPLEGLVWDFRRDAPPGDLAWEVWDSEPLEVVEGQDVVLEVVVPEDAGAVLVAYEVFLDAYGLDRAVGHFLNEAVLEAKSPPAIVEIMVNFDIHNDTGLDVTNFELDFHGLDFGCEDVRGAVGFIAAQGIPPVPVIPPVIWGANEANPLVVRPIPGGTEVKWIQPDRPLKTCEWLHVGLVFDCTNFDCFNNPDDPALRANVQGYWTVIEPCPELGVYVDIKPGSCPNPLNVTGKGVLPVAVVGTDDLNVTQIDPATVKLEGVAPLRWAVEDAATPFDGELCDCHDLNGDGVDDLSLKFDTQEIVAALGAVNDGDELVLTLTGELWDGTPFKGEDCMRVLQKISRVRPRVREPGQKVRIVGYNFGDIQGDNVVHIGGSTFDSSSVNITLWSDNIIKMKMPKRKCKWFNGEDFRHVKVWLTMDGVYTNKKRITVMKPATCP